MRWRFRRLPPSMGGILSGGPLASKEGILSYNDQTSLEAPQYNPLNYRCRKEERPLHLHHKIDRGLRKQTKIENFNKSTSTLRSACHRKEGSASTKKRGGEEKRNVDE